MSQLKECCWVKLLKDIIGTFSSSFLRASYRVNNRFLFVYFIMGTRSYTGQFGILGITVVIFWYPLISSLLWFSIGTQIQCRRFLTPPKNIVFVLYFSTGTRPCTRQPGRGTARRWGSWCAPGATSTSRTGGALRPSTSAARTVTMRRAASSCWPAANQTSKIT